jgi:alkanesulfonate monooxygenase SsuD/methylene tetrahydromethanopterin reductase-like flavin-dependent oxidoreductase (luciferase family)
VRSPLTDQSIAPAIEPDSIPTWVGVGGSPQSVVRAARYGLPLMLAIIGGHPSRFAPYVDLYHRALEQFGQATLPVGQHSLGFVAATDEEAREAYWPQWKSVMTMASKERGFPAPSAERFDAEIAAGALFVGSPETVAAKVLESIRDLGLSRFDLKYDIGRIAMEQRVSSITLFGREVIPRVREALAAEPVAAGDRVDSHA